MKRSPILNTEGLYIIETDDGSVNGKIPGIEKPELYDIAVRRMDGQLFIYKEDRGWDLLLSDERQVVLEWFRESRHPLLRIVEERYSWS